MIASPSYQTITATTKTLATKSAEGFAALPSAAATASVKFMPNNETVAAVTNSISDLYAMSHSSNLNIHLDRAESSSNGFLNKSSNKNSSRLQQLLLNSNSINVKKYFFCAFLVSFILIIYYNRWYFDNIKSISLSWRHIISISYVFRLKRDRAFLTTFIVVRRSLRCFFRSQHILFD